MRTYPSNSPQAAARIVVLAMLADAQMCQAEVNVLNRLRADELLGLRPDELQCIVHSMCNDMLLTAEMTWADACQVAPHTLVTLMAEIDDPELRVTVLALCIAVIEADGRVVEGEELVLRTAIEQWGMQRWMMRPERLNRSAVNV